MWGIASRGGQWCLLLDAGAGDRIARQNEPLFTLPQGNHVGGVFMAFCSACGAEVGGAAFCPKCGANQSAVAATTAPAAAAPATAGMEENIAGLLCYLFGWISGLIFLLIDKRPLIRFHGAQSIAFNIAFFAVWLVFWVVSMTLTVVTAAMHIPIGFLSFFLAPVIWIGFIIIWIFLMYKAYNREKFKLPIIGNIVENMVK